MVLCLWEVQINNFLLAVVLTDSNLSIRRIVTVVWYVELLAVIGETSANCVDICTISESPSWNEMLKVWRTKVFATLYLQIGY
jgi:hypothetical protein